VYNDNFKQSEAELIENFGLNDDTCNFLNNVYGTRSHSGWLSFIYPRLMLAKELLTDDGVIFISIDDNEQANLKIICDEIFGEKNFVGNITWIRRTKPINSGEAKYQLQKKVEYIATYCKSKNSQSTYSFELPIQKVREYKHDGKFGKCRIKDIEDSDIGTKNRDTMKFPILGVTPSSGKRWKIGYEEVNRLLEKQRIININGKIKIEIYPDDEEGIQYKPFWSHLEQETTGTAENGKSELKNTLSKDVGFETVKPINLIKEIISFLPKNLLILDFFAGSGTTAHAVMQLNAEDGGNRKFILCQLDEAIDPKKSKPAYDFCIENNFEPVISSITLERVNRAGDKIQLENKDKKIDIGYKVFSLIDKPKVNYDANHEPTFFLNRTRETALDTLVNMLVATCQTLDTKIETIKENAIYKANNEIYVTGTITADDLEGFKDLKINIDALADINLTDYMNISLNFGDNMKVIF
jgi:adenine-specific DNA-methyltransferase